MLNNLPTSNSSKDSKLHPVGTNNDKLLLPTMTLQTISLTNFLTRILVELADLLHTDSVNPLQLSDLVLPVQLETRLAMEAISVRQCHHKRRSSQIGHNLSLRLRGIQKNMVQWCKTTRKDALK